MSPHTKFYGSQVGGTKIIPHSYTGSPLALLRHDISSAFSFFLFLPFIVFPLSPQSSGELCELYPSAANLRDMFLHLILICMQLPFILSIPLWVFFPVWSVLLGVTAFLLVNQAICWLLNGGEARVESGERFAGRREEFKHEKWIFLNGVAVGKHWLQSNVDRLALTFGRPVLGVHNNTNGIIFDVLQCLIQRNFNYATQDIRGGYAVVKSTLYDPTLTKVVFILHSQGAIEGGMIIDWLLQEVPQDLLSKLEVYTFGNAANHFNNPHSHLLSQSAALRHPTLPSTTRITTTVNYHDPLTPPEQFGSGGDAPINSTNETTRLRNHKLESSSGKAIRYIEHYAHTSDFVARWGVLHFTCNFNLSPSSPRFMGRVFERVGEGHQFNQHYLDNMFPLKKAAPTSNPHLRGGIGNSGFEGVDEEGSEFMESILEMGIADESSDEREGVEISYLGAHGEPLVNGEREVLLRDMSPSSSGVGDLFGAGRGMTGLENDVEFKVKNLSRLWLYVNGKSPKSDETDLGIARMATI